MTKKDYIKFADMFSKWTQSVESKDCLLVKQIIEDFMDILYKDNPNFNYGKFRLACGITYSA